MAWIRLTAKHTHLEQRAFGMRRARRARELSVPLRGGAPSRAGAAVFIGVHQLEKLVQLPCDVVGRVAREPFLDQASGLVVLAAIPGESCGATIEDRSGRLIFQGVFQQLCGLALVFERKRGPARKGSRDKRAFSAKAIAVS
jgi:hypothetical protein